MAGKDYTVWSQELSWVCPVCGFKLQDDKIHSDRRDNMYGFYACSSCGIESIIPREYW
jgi:predicted RNA-binding Zn-ribbon protein involved in translation (DUF1610 family)